MTQPEAPLSVRTKVLFSTGDISSSLPLAIQMFFQLYFLTDVARLSPATAGWVLGITRAWDAVNDPIVGLLSDRIKSRFGRRRLLMVSGAIPLGIFFAISWLVPPFSEAGLAVFYILAIIAFDTAFTVVHVGYNSLTPGMTYDYDERSTLNGYRMVVSLCGTLAAIIFATLLDQVFESDIQRFAIIGISLGVVAAIPPWIVASVATEPSSEGQPEPLSLVQALRATISNRAFVMLMVIYLASWTAASVLASMLVFYATYYLSVPDQANYFVLLAEGAAVLFVPVVVILARRLEKPRAYIVGIVIWCVVLLAISAVGREALGIAYILAFLCGPGIATALVVPWSMVPDIIEDDEFRTGRRREGAYYALVAFFQKLGTGFALWAVGQLLAMSGYVTPSDGTPYPVQPETVLQAMRLIIGPLTVGLLLVSLPVALWYPINRFKHREMLQELRTRRQTTT